MNMVRIMDPRRAKRRSKGKKLPKKGRKEQRRQVLGDFRLSISVLPSSVKPQLPAAAKLAELQPYFAFHSPRPPCASRF